MVSIVWISTGIVVGLLVFVYVLYTRMIRLKNTALEALSGIDVQLRKRHDLISNLLKLARRYMEHEIAIIKEVTELRVSAEKAMGTTDPSEAARRFSAESALTSGIGRLFAVMENYPDLKADQPIIEAQQAYQEVEGHVSAARRFYNAAVADLNSAIETFPGPFIAPLAKAKPMPLYEVEDAAVRKPIDADDFLL
jgi:LemA protein